MFIVIQHQISNPEKFWGTAQEATSKLPADLKLHSSFPNSDGSKAVCVWEANELNTVKELVEGSVGQFSNNEYFAVDAKNAMGLPK
jgi:hypothetical protein